MTIKVGKDREIRFDKSLRLPRQDNYDIGDYESVPFRFVTGDRFAYKNLNLSIFVDDYCNADCKFCVAQLRYAHRGLMYLKPHIEDDATYLRRVEEVLERIRPLDPSVSITGGEPTLSARLPEVLRIVDSLGFRKRTITTNGSGLMTRRNGKTVLEHLLEHRWDHFSISRAHHDDEVNRRIMRFTKDSEYFGKDALRQVLRETAGTDLHHRMSCLLLREGIATVDGIRDYVDACHELGADNFIFRELMDYDRTAVNSEKIAYCDANKVRLNDIWADLEGVPEFEPYLNILGYYYYVEIYKYRGCTVASESADMRRQYAEKGKHPEMVYEMVLHNNGNLCGSWVDTEDVLDPFQL